MAARRPATIEDVAREAGVSRQTVSNVLNSPAIVRDATRERVRAVCRFIASPSITSGHRG
ncbi:MAG: LacI family DNA-binding transcriptional regulator, partial [Microbacterium sp.]|nr:LacI family DNA-binding transcriptional regulator [Microbacterium sp.]